MAWYDSLYKAGSYLNRANPYGYIRPLVGNVADVGATALRYSGVKTPEWHVSETLAGSPTLFTKAYANEVATAPSTTNSVPGGTVTTFNNPTPGSPNTGGNPSTNTKPGTGTKTGTISAGTNEGGDIPSLEPIYSPQWAWWMGNKYDLNNTDQFNSYTGARKDYINSQYDRQLARGKTSYDQNVAQIGTDLGNLETNQTDYLTDWQNQYSGAMGGISNRYAQLGDIYQSSQGVREQNVTDISNREKARTTENYNQQKSAMEQDQANIGTWWQDTQADTNTARTQDLDQINQALSEQESEAEAARLSGMTLEDYRRGGAYTPLEKMTALAGEVSKLGVPVGSAAYKQGVRTALQRGGYQALDDQGLAATANAAKAANRYYDLLNEYGDPNRALSALTPAERQLLSQLGV